MFTENNPFGLLVIAIASAIVVILIIVGIARDQLHSRRERRRRSTYGTVHNVMEATLSREDHWTLRYALIRKEIQERQQELRLASVGTTDGVNDVSPFRNAARIRADIGELIADASSVMVRANYEGYFFDDDKDRFVYRTVHELLA